MSSSNSGGTLRPAWNRGNSKGFQPPPQVEQQQSSRSNIKSHRNDNTTDDKQNVNQQTSQRDNYNKFSALDIDDDDVVLATTTSGASSSLHNNTANDGISKASIAGKPTETKTTNSRSEGLRSGTGRSLADLAAREPIERTSSRFSNLRASGSSTEGAPMDTKSTTTTPYSTAVEEKVIRYTRERILSLRPTPLPTPTVLLKKELEGSAILSDTAQDPVCWDNLDAEKIWSTVPTRRAVKDDSGTNTIGLRRASSITAVGTTTSVRRDSSVRDGGGGGGRWQRGVALPPEGSALPIAGKQNRGGREGGGTHHHKDAENPNDLWDDPAASGDGALMDFSAFGDTGNDAFDFDKMADASKKLEDELHGTRSRASSNATNDVDEPIPLKSVNPNRPLATAGTTIRSGSGDHVNVFEDFDDPGIIVEDVSASTKITEETSTAASESPNVSTIKAANEDPSASSRLMAMIGVKKDDTATPDASLTAWGQPATASSTIQMPVVSLNPWGDPIVPPTSSTGSVSLPVVNSVTLTAEMQQHGLDLQARLRQAELEKQKAEESRRLQEELQRQRQQQEQERVHALQQQQQQQQQQQAGVQSQVELVLMERISNILESSWGRSDLVTILSTLHSEDPRVVPLLNNIDALRALLLRNSRRVALRQDPTLRIETASLLMTNAQWRTQQQQQEAMQQQQQQQQQQQALQLQQQQEELQRLERQRRLEEQQAAAARAQQQQQQQIIPDAPWFYSDPSKNIQGPFRGEEMRQWLEAGYFKGDLPISQNPAGPFRPLAVIFTDLSVAFMNPKSVTSKSSTDLAKLEEQRRREQAERTRIEAEAVERERLRAEEQQREKEEAAAAAAEQRRRQQADAKANAKADKVRTSNGENESSNQLKLMLGVGAFKEIQQQSQPSNIAKNDQQETHRQVLEESKSYPEPSTPTVPAKNAAPAWGGAAVVQPVTKKSMSEIQKEEARAAAVAAMNRQGSKPSSSGWANVAAAKGGSTAWSGGVAKPQISAAVITTPAPVATVQRAVPSRSVSHQPTTAVLSTGPTSNVTQQGQVQRATSVAARETGTANAFGAKMDPSLEKWCKDQMYKLNGTDDLTLVDFCMILTDSEEIRQYLTAYLGSTPQVNSFATEFIQRKGGNQKKNVEEWESTATIKKGKKKKAGP